MRSWRWHRSALAAIRDCNFCVSVRRAFADLEPHDFPHRRPLPAETAHPFRAAGRFLRRGRVLYVPLLARVIALAPLRLLFREMKRVCAPAAHKFPVVPTPLFLGACFAARVRPGAVRISHQRLVLDERFDRLIPLALNCEHILDSTITVQLLDPSRFCSSLFSVTAHQPPSRRPLQAQVLLPAYHCGTNSR